MAHARPRYVEDAAERLAGPPDAMPVAAFVAPDGTGRTETLDALAEILDARGTDAVRVSGRHDVDVDVGTLTQAGVVLVVDDAHLLPAAPREALRAVAGASDTGLVIAIAPSPPGGDDPLVAAIARAGSVVRPGPLGADDVAVRAERLLEARPDPAVVELLLVRAGGHARLTDRLVSAWRDAGSIEQGALRAEPEMTPAEVADLVTALAAELSPGPQAALTALSIGPALDDELLVALCDLPVEAAPALWHELRAAGFLVPDHEEPLPIVADAVATRVDAATRRDLHRRIAGLLAERGAPPAQIADHLVAADARGTDVAHVLAAAGEAALAEAPGVAADLLGRAVDAGIDPALLAGARAEAAALSGDEDAAIALADGAIGGSVESTARAELVLAGVLARRGLWAPALRSYGVISEHPRLPEGAVRALGTVAEAALGRREPDDAPSLDDAAGPPGVIAADVARFLGRAAQAGAGGDAVAARRFAGEAADLLESAGAPVVLPETPHVLAALVALATGDSEDAERMAGRGADAEIGGPAALRRHRLLGGFAAMRAGRWDRAQQAVDAAAGPCTTRDDLLRGALAAAVARRAGDVARLVETWDAVSPALGAVHGDLFLLLPLTELVVVSARLGRRDATAPREAELDEVLDGLGRPGLWARPLAWARVEAAVAADDADGLAAATTELAGAPAAHDRLTGLDAAARAWQHVLAGGSDDLEAGVAGLERAGLVWEASRLVGQAAIRAADPGETRSLLGRARELKGTLLVLDEAGVPTGTVLSTREQEVAACVVDGLTHKEIGAMLFISPKTVEHHVARIRQKLGATSRAELLAGLRSTLAAAE